MGLNEYARCSVRIRFNADCSPEIVGSSDGRTEKFRRYERTHYIDDHNDRKLLTRITKTNDKLVN